MKILSEFVEFCNFQLSLLTIRKFLCNFLASLKIQKFWSHSMRAMAKVKSINITVIYVIVHTPAVCIIKRLLP